MIENFPNFSKLEISQKAEIEQITKRYDPYSDFNFTSLFCWNTNGSTEVSLLNENLVIKMPDYISGKPVYSILGNNEVNKSIEDLLSITPVIKLVPEVVISHLKQSGTLRVEEDRDNYDYVYKLSGLSALEGRTFKWKRKRLNKLERIYENRLNFESFTKDLSLHRKRLISIFDNWADQNSKNAEEIEAERQALGNIIQLNKTTENIILNILSIDGKDIGLSINELHFPTSTCHFQKSLKDIVNIDILLTNYTAKLLVRKKSEYINWEQDLGIEGLRKFKQSYQPIKLLKKYNIFSCD